jgi:hypothetical protein
VKPRSEAVSATGTPPISPRSLRTSAKMSRKVSPPALKASTFSSVSGIRARQPVSSHSVKGTPTGSLSSMRTRMPGVSSVSIGVTMTAAATCILGLHQRHAHAEHRDGVVLFVKQKLEHLAAFGLALFGGGDAAQFPVVEDLGHIGLPGSRAVSASCAKDVAGQRGRDQCRGDRKGFQGVEKNGHGCRFLCHLACFR